MEKTKLIDEYSFEFLKERFQSIYPCDEYEFLGIVEEFKKFLKLVLKQDKPLAMIGKGIDELWHTFIIHTPQYREFCEEVFGEFIDHQPHGPQTPVPEEALTNFFEIYPKEFGVISSEWTDGYEPAFIASLQSGVVPEGFVYKWSGWTGRAK